MNSEILIFSEAKGARRIPSVIIVVNGKEISHTTKIVQSEEHYWKLIWKLSVELQSHNVLQIKMHDKTDLDNITATGQVIDHAVMVKQITVDDVEAGWLLYKRSFFEHNMPESWVQEMASKGYIIEPIYSPGTDLQLNGTMTFEFDSPFWIDVVTATSDLKI